jgi:hypothetical protein
MTHREEEEILAHHANRPRIINLHQWKIGDHRGEQLDYFHARQLE